MFMDSEQWATIRRMREVDKQSISAISRQLHIHRDTVRRALTSIAGPPANEPRGRLAEDKLCPFTRYIGDRLKEYPALTASKLLLEIRKQGYRGGYTILSYREPSPIMRKQHTTYPVRTSQRRDFRTAVKSA